MQHTFDYNGIPVTVYSATVKTRVLRSLLIGKLEFIYGVSYKTLPDVDIALWLEFASVIAQTRAEGAAWWCEVGASLDVIKATYETFLDSDESLSHVLAEALSAVTPQKKTS